MLEYVVNILMITAMKMTWKIDYLVFLLRKNPNVALPNADDMIIETDRSVRFKKKKIIQNAMIRINEMNEENISNVEQPSNTDKSCEKCINLEEEKANLEKEKEKANLEKEIWSLKSFLMDLTNKLTDANKNKKKIKLYVQKTKRLITSRKLLPDQLRNIKIR